MPTSRPAGVAGLIATAARARSTWTRSTLVGNDSGRRLLADRARPARRAARERVARLVLTSCETPYDEWPPPPFDGLPAAARDPEALGQLLGALGTERSARHPPPTASWSSTPGRSGLGLLRPAGRRTRACCATSPRRWPSASTAPVRAAGASLIERFDQPVLLAWSREDEVFPIAHAERYAAALPDGQRGADRGRLQLHARGPAAGAGGCSRSLRRRLDMVRIQAVCQRRAEAR